MREEAELMDLQDEEIMHMRNLEMRKIMQFMSRDIASGAGIGITTTAREVAFDDRSSDAGQ